MTDTKKFLRGGLSREQENTLEDVSGGLDFVRPLHDPDPDPEQIPCPVCGGIIVKDFSSEKVFCPGCKRWFRFEGSALVEVQP